MTLTGTVPELLKQLEAVENFEPRSMPSFAKQLKAVVELKGERTKVFGFSSNPIRCEGIDVVVIPE